MQTKLIKIKLSLILLLINVVCLAYTNQDHVNKSFKSIDNDTLELEKQTYVVVKVYSIDVLGGDFITRSFSIPLGFEIPMKRNYSLHIGTKYIFTVVAHLRNNHAKRSI